MRILVTIIGFRGLCVCESVVCLNNTIVRLWMEFKSVPHLSALIPGNRFAWQIPNFSVKKKIVNPRKKKRTIYNHVLGDTSHLSVEALEESDMLQIPFGDEHWFSDCNTVLIGLPVAIDGE